jgi:hypothetical protein
MCMCVSVSVLSPNMRHTLSAFDIVLSVAASAVAGIKIAHNCNAGLLNHELRNQRGCRIQQETTHRVRL